MNETAPPRAAVRTLSWRELSLIFLFWTSLATVSSVNRLLDPRGFGFRMSPTAPIALPFSQSAAALFRDRHRRFRARILSARPDAAGGSGSIAGAACGGAARCVADADQSALSVQHAECDVGTGRARSGGSAADDRAP